MKKFLQWSVGIFVGTGVLALVMYGTVMEERKIQAEFRAKAAFMRECLAYKWEGQCNALWRYREQ